MTVLVVVAAAAIAAGSKPATCHFGVRACSLPAGGASAANQPTNRVLLIDRRQFLREIDFSQLSVIMFTVFDTANANRMSGS